ncbi:TPA: PapB/FocB family fimbrial expression transcriptional regulator [Escherichia coli]|uniref:PapB/FocB family fimbrial expression transcriptional regulator n=1 Tax=Escherichia coli TaxID=562 RepID=UPI000775297A|nr:PapB/FocB family fimbrial expression transcriptional regulator [Escherichia coli]EFC4831820.1 transcriptional regulator [Escherichia coli]EFC6933145.1 transcriptional regulator [Escherichia coli]EJN3746745.1 transcriptional regulator [Escherichia coli]EJN3789963.1 transcriptional regulator [Escherichia coli]EKQ7016151.1 transcriptional regulator [Escherichia coli]
MELNEFLYTSHQIHGGLIPGKVKEKQFFILVEMSALRSERIICALREYLVHGENRVFLCEKYNVGNSHFSISLDRLQHLSFLASQLSGYYQ